MGKPYFFAPYRDIPISNRRTARLEPAFYATQQKFVSWDPKEWITVPRPETFRFLEKWPPTSLSELTAADEDHVPCFHCSRTCFCDCSLAAWRKKRAIWTAAALQLNSILGPGSGLFITCDLYEQTVIGEITGRLVPYLGSSNSESRNLEQTEFLIGHSVLQKPGAVIHAVIDGFDAGSLMKFLNHSCNPNSEIVSGRIGMTRGVFVRALRDIAAGEELTIQMSNCMSNPHNHCRNPRCHCGPPMPPGL